MALEIAVASGKGGVGKSTVSSALAIYLHRKDYDVIAVDADADAPNLHLVLEVDKWEKEEWFEDAWISEIDYSKCTNCGICAEVCPYEAVELTGNKYTINPVICEGCLTCILACPEKAIRRVKTGRGYVRLAKTRYGFPLWMAELLPGRPNTGKLVTEIKNRAKAMARENTIIVVDSAAGIGCQVISSLAGANAAILVTEPTPAGLSDLKRVHTIAKQFLLPSALIINKYDINPEYLDKILAYAKEENIDVLGMIPYDDHVPAAIAKMKHPIKLYPDSPAAKALLDISRKVENTIVRNWREWARRHMPRKPVHYTPILIKPREIGARR
ncbi:MAG: ATPase [Hyperthermus sp.]|nr:MAG: ATPase [Hyperthermus sp.]